MTRNYSNAYHNLCDNYLTASGLEVPDGFSIWFECYRDSFLEELLNAGHSFSAINSIIQSVYDDAQQYFINGHAYGIAPDDLGPENVGEKSRAAAYGIILLDEIVMLFKDPFDPSAMFSCHQSLIESAQYCGIVIYRETLDKMRMSDIGSIGAINRHKQTNELKDWALEQIKSLRMDDRLASEYLSDRIPEHLANASKNPEQLIYRALLARHQAK